jgi:hypothetical protein
MDLEFGPSYLFINPGSSGNIALVTCYKCITKTKQKQKPKANPSKKTYMID